MRRAARIDRNQPGRIYLNRTLIRVNENRALNFGKLINLCYGCQQSGMVTQKSHWPGCVPQSTAFKFFIHLSLAS